MEFATDEQTQGDPRARGATTGSPPSARPLSEAPGTLSRRLGIEMTECSRKRSVSQSLVARAKSCAEGIAVSSDKRALVAHSRVAVMPRREELDDSEETVWYIYPWFFTLQYAGAVLLL